MRFFDWLKDLIFGKVDPATLPKPLARPSVLPLTGKPVTQPEDRTPIIGISGGADGSKSVAAMFSQIRAMGGEPRFIGKHAERIKEFGGIDQAVERDLKKLDALIVMGNDGDIDPAKYGAEKHPQTKIETDLGRASYEETAIQKALDLGMPLAGICGGMQRINVLGGGTLDQHVPDKVGDNHHMQSDGPFVPTQIVTVAQDSKLGDIAGKTRSIYTPTHQELPPGVFMENSFHHQAVKAVRSDFRVNATSDDGIIEGIEPKPGSTYANQYVMGVQWHPEFGASDLGPKIASSIVSAARLYAHQQASERQETPEETTILQETMLEKMVLRRRQEAALMR